MTEYLLLAKHLTALSHMIFYPSPHSLGGRHYYPDFPDEENNAQRS